MYWCLRSLPSAIFSLLVLGGGEVRAFAPVSKCLAKCWTSYQESRDNRNDEEANYKGLIAAKGTAAVADTRQQQEASAGPAFLLRWDRASELCNWFGGTPWQQQRNSGAHSPEVYVRVLVQGVYIFYEIGS